MNINNLCFLLRNMQNYPLLVVTKDKLYSSADKKSQLLKLWGMYMTHEPPYKSFDCARRKLQHMSCVIRKPAFNIYAKTKAHISGMVTMQLISAFDFAT